MAKAQKPQSVVLTIDADGTMRDADGIVITPPRSRGEFRREVAATAQACIDFVDAQKERLWNKLVDAVGDVPIGEIPRSAKHGRERQQQQRAFSVRGADARRRPDSPALARAVSAHRRANPDATDAEIARVLYPAFGNGRQPDSLRRDISRLKK